MTLDSSSQDRLTRDTKVSAALSHAGGEALVVQPETPLREIAVAAAAHPSVRVICVAGADRRLLVGLIRLSALCDDLFLHIAPEEFIAEALEPSRLAEIGRMLRAKTAADLMEAPESVVETDSIAVAFRRMHERGLDGLPVVDAGGRPVGYLDRLRLIAVWLQTHPGLRSP